MQKHLRIMLLMAALLVPWVTQGQGASVLNCTFENDSDNAGWVFVNGDATNRWYIDTAVANGGTKSLYISNTGGTSHFYTGTSATNVYAYRELELAAGAYFLSFDWLCEGEVYSGSPCDYMRVFLVPSTTSITAGSAPSSSWVSVDGGALHSAATWQNHLQDVVIDAAGTYKLVVYWTNDQYVASLTPAAIDNIAVTANSCPLPTVSEIWTTTDSAYISMIGVSADSYTIEYADSNFTPGANQATSVTSFDNPVMLGGLAPGTTYYYTIAANCGANVSEAVSGTFRTRCLATTVPFHFGFETTDSLALCWTTGRAGANAGTSYPNMSSGGSRYEGTRSMYVPADAGDCKYWAALPAIDGSLSDYMLAYYVKNGSTSTNSRVDMQVGYMTDVTDPSTFVPIRLSNPNSAEWIKEAVSFQNIEDLPNTTYIAFMFDGASYTRNNDFYIDNVSVTMLPTCPEVADITVHPSVTSAVVTWNYDAHTGSSVPDAYDVYYAPLHDLTYVNSEHATATTATLVGLTPGNQYKLWIVPTCGAEETAIIDTILFVTTTPSCVVLDTTSMFTSIIGEATTYSQNCLFPNTYTNRYMQMIFTASEIDTAANIVKIAFQRHAGDTAAITTISKAEIWLAHTSASSFASAIIPYDPATFKMVRTGALTITDSGWVELELSEPFAYNGFDNLLVILNSTVTALDGGTYFAYSNASYKVAYRESNSAYDATTATGFSIVSNDRPNIRFVMAECGQYADCAAPTVVVDAVGDTAAHIVWAPGNTESAWNVYFRQQDSTIWQLYAEETTDTEITVAGLSAAHSYEVAVMGICADSLMTTVTFTTECGPIYRNALPYIVDLTNLATGEGTLPNCWTRGSDASNPYIYNDVYNQLGRKALYFYYEETTTRTEMAAVLPMSEMAVDSLEMIVELYKSSASVSGALVVGVMDDPTDFSTLIDVDTISADVAQRWVSKTIDFKDYAGEGRYIVFHVDGSLCGARNYDYTYLSNIQLLRRASCRPLTAATAINVTYESADIKIEDDDNDGDNSYVVYYGTENDLAAATDSIVFFDDIVPLTNLSGRTTYYVWVKVRCAEENSRVTALSFTTLPACATVQNLQVQYSLANNTAVLSWNTPTEGRAATEYVVSVKADAAAWVSDTVEDNFYRFAIDTNVNYQYKVVTVCDTLAGLESSGSFQPIARCTEVANAETFQYNVPLQTMWNYSYSQSIYLASELSNMGDTIRGLYYSVMSGDAFNYTIDVYLGNTTASEFSTNASWVPLSDLSLVADDYVMTMPSSGTLYIPFDTFFVRDAARNIVIAIDNNTGDYNATTIWNSTNTPNAYRAIYYYEDPEDILPSNPDNGVTVAMVPDVRFDATCNTAPGCGNPMLIATDITPDAIALQWYAGGSETAWDVDYREQGADTWINFRTATTDTAALLSGLQMATTYEVRVSTTCGGNINRVTQTFTTGCAIYALPRLEDFAALQLGVFDASCWQSGATDETYPEIANYGSYDRMLEVVDGAYVVAPDFDANANEMQVNFSYLATAPGSFIYVGIIADPNAIATFVPIDTIVANNANTLTNATVHFNGYDFDAGNICFYVPAGYPLQGSFYIDNLLFDYHSDCPTVDSIWNVASTVNSESIAWSTDGMGTAASYLVEYGVAGFTPGTGTFMSVPSAAATISGLTMGTMYDLYVTPICSTGDTMYRSSLYSFATACGVMPVPYSMNFDLPYLPALDDTEMLPTCWNYEMVTSQTNSNYYVYPQICDAGSSAVNDTFPYVLYMYYDAIVALPEFDAPLDTLQLSFYAAARWSGDYLIVGVVDSVAPGFAASFVPIDTITTMGSYETVFFCNYTGTGRHIALRNVSSYGDPDAPYVIEDVVVDYRPACMPVTNIVVTGNTESSASIRWNAPLCDVPSGYDVEYGSQGFVQGTGTTLTATADSVTITGLAAATTYDVYIRPHCANGSNGDWTLGSFYTAMCTNVAASPLYDTSATATNVQFDAIPGDSYWEYTLSEVIYDSATLADAGFVAGSIIAGFSFYPATMPANGGATFNLLYTNCDVYLKHTTKDEFANTNDYELFTTGNLVFSGDLNWDSVGRRDVYFQRAFVWDGASNIVIAIDRNDGVSAEGARFAGQTGTLNRALHAHQYSTDINPITGSGMAWYTNALTATIPNYDFFTCVALVCDAPVVTVTNTHNDATLSWTSEATEFEVSVKAVADSIWPAEVIVNANSYTATGLQPATQYQYRVRTLCEYNERSEWAEGTFTTDNLPCYVPTNLSATSTLDVAELSWTAGSDETAWNIRVWNTAFDSTYHVTANPFTVTGLTPGVTYQAAIQSVCGGGLATSEFSDTITFTTDVCDSVTNVQVSGITTSTATVTWSAGENNEGNFVVEYGIQGFAAGYGTVVEATVATVTLSDLEEETSYDVYVRAVCDEQYNSAWSSVVTFTTFAGGTGDTTTTECGRVTDVAASNITNTEATITWTPGENNGNNFEVKYGAHGFDIEAGSTVSATAPSIMLTELTKNSEYDVYVRAICADSSSDWSDVYTFRTTNVGINTVDCNAMVAIYPNPAEQNTTIRVSGVEGEVTVTIVDMNGRTVSTYTMECGGDCEKTMNVDGLAAGSYFVRLQGNGLNAVKKLVVK